MYTDIVLSTIVKLHTCSFHCVADENADDMEASLTQAEESRRSFKRQDSVLSQNFSSMVYRSWKGSKGFRGYRERLGTSIHHRYCMC